MAFPATNLFARYEAKLDTGYSNGQDVDPATDQSGNSRNAVSSTNNPPSYVTGVLNGEPVYRFDAANTEALLTADLSLTGFSAFTVSVVVATSAEGSSRVWPGGVWDSTTYILGITEGVTASEWGSFSRSSAGTQQEATSGVDTTAFCVLTLVWNATTAELFRNGTSVGSTALGGTIDVNKVSMGDVGLLTEYFDGDIALMAAWDAALDSTARADLHSYVQDTYGISVSDYSGASTGATHKLAGRGGGLVGPGGLAGRGGGLVSRSMEKVNGIWRPRLWPVGLDLQGA